MRSMFFTCVVALAWMFGDTPSVWSQQLSWTWYDVDAKSNVRINVYLFWSQSCPHCPAALDFVTRLQRDHSWVNVYAYEVSSNAANRELYRQMAATLNEVGGQTPAFFYGKRMTIGYGSYEQTGRRIEQSLVRWYEALREHYRRYPPTVGKAAVGIISLVSDSTEPPSVERPEPGDLPVQPPELPAEEEAIHIPGWGEVEAGTMSLPAFTLVIAACDAFNPCAFFVLLLLLSLLVHGQSRVRMLIVGGVFVFFSGFLYFVFMAAWMNLYFVIGHLSAITVTAGLIAVGIGLLNVKDFFWFKQGPSLSIPDSARPDLFQRMSRLIKASSLPGLLAGAAALAATANLYELLCTSGFPMVYTRVLTMRQLPAAEYYAYLVLYNLIYVAPMALIVIVFALTLGAWKLTEYGGRVLKLLSGIMMAALGVILLIWPEILHNVLGAVGLLAFAGSLTIGIMAADIWWRKHGQYCEKGTGDRVMTFEDSTSR